ncbi:GNAT family N-acetyltransferase [Flavobacterium sp. ASW18X]|uniref:GNAT family N-acetyltransferase n=1 Tax=Flavobacterium sp. ASW18X TaxID=2572595 RepID=UPI0010AE310D|nr:GNAT family N-acetyltransferase [Flavobacterium sp. ASW18X]TKD66479.1 GNAT family N-acetyltransferase [Flavobacterium sp. ASW18X]
MEIKIRIAEKKDVESMYRLIKELALFEKEPDAVKISEADLEKAGFGAQPLYHCFVAEAEEQIIGMALVYPRYSTWQGPVIHLEDLIVTQSYRGKGLGSKLLDAVVAYGKEQGVRRISWEVLDWNEPAIKFYESKGANVMRDWDVVQLDQKGIENYLTYKG